jgi:tetratricopeptide (TPR) repeat protein
VTGGDFILTEVLDEAIGAFNDQRYLDVEILCTSIIEIDDDCVDALFFLAMAQSELGKDIDALNNYDRALAIRPAHAEALNNRGNSFQELGRFEEALESYNRALAVEPKHPEALYNRGNALQQLGRFDEAVNSYGRALAVQPNNAEALNNRGNSLQELGRFEAALESYNRALAIQPDHPEALYNRGNALLRLGRFDEALSGYDRVLAVQPDYTEAINNRGNSLHELGRCEEAVESYDRVLAVWRDNPDVLYSRANALQQIGRFDGALMSYDRALSVRPDFPEALNNRGITLRDLKCPDEALESFDRALAINPDFAEALNNRGNVLEEFRRFDEALVSYHRALAINPDFAEALNNCGNALHASGRFAEALESYDRALAIRPDYPEALDNRGVTLQELGRFDEAMETHRQALAVRPYFPACQLNRAHLLLLTGQFAEGWRGYEWRRRMGAWIVRSHSLFGGEWRKDESVPRRLLLYSEQGLGDTIQFSRFASTVAARGAEVVLEVQPPLSGLLSCLENVKVIRNGETLPQFEAHLPLMSLPQILQITPATMPERVPYLFADPARVEAWARRLPAGRFKVGIVWQGKPTGDVDRGRSIPLRCFAPLCGVHGVTLISLQKYDGVEQLTDLPAGMKVETLGADFDAGPDAFVDCAAVMMNLDLVISSDTAAVHLAGALGCPVWIALQLVPDWRWMMDREDTPWYPSARLFRQTHRGDWDEVFERIAEQLALSENINARKRAESGNDVQDISGGGDPYRYRDDGVGGGG